MGDLDSVRPEVLKFYETHGSHIEKKPSQYENDFEKSVNYLMLKYSENQGWQQKKESKLYILGASGGRLDHTLSNLSMQYRFAKEIALKHDNFAVSILTKNTLAMCILPGKTTYIRTSIEADDGVGLIPLSGPCEKTVTTGFRWNLGSHFYKLLYTNNFLN